MFKKSRKDQFVEQAQGVAQDLSDAIAPRVADARVALADARDVIAPKVADARDAIGPKVAEARDVVAPRVAEVRDQVSNQLAHAVSEAREQAAVVAAEAERRSALAGAALRGEDVQPPSGPSKKKQLLVILVLAAIGALVASKLAGGDSADNWQSSYTPAPAPTPAPAAPYAGASPGETVADAVEEPHPVTTPENPVETVEIDEGNKRS